MTIKTSYSIELFFKDGSKVTPETDKSAWSSGPGYDARTGITEKREGKTGGLSRIAGRLAELIPIMEARFEIPVRDSDDLYEIAERMKKQHDDYIPGVKDIPYGVSGVEFLSGLEFLRACGIRGVVRRHD